MGDDTIERYKRAAKQGNLGEEIGKDVYTAARKATGFIDRNTPGSPHIQAQDWSIYRDTLAMGKRGKEALKEYWEEGKRKVGKILGSKRKGGRIKKTGLYRLHRGEAVRRSRGR